jgi:hypothetical protein
MVSGDSGTALCPHCGAEIHCSACGANLATGPKSTLYNLPLIGEMVTPARLLPFKGARSQHWFQASRTRSVENVPLLPGRQHHEAVSRLNEEDSGALAKWVSQTQV